MSLVISGINRANPHIIAVITYSYLVKWDDPPNKDH